MFEGPGNPELVEELQEKLASFGSQILLTARLLRWACSATRTVALMPSAIALGEKQLKDEACSTPETRPLDVNWDDGWPPLAGELAKLIVWMVEIRHRIYTSAMALSIKSDEADQLARELAAETGETLTEAVVIALRERLDREHARHGASMRVRLARLAADVATLPVADGRTPEDIVGYDDAGLPS
jgi:antitoxin VapB